MAFTPIPEEKPLEIQIQGQGQGKDGIKGTISLIKSIPGLFALIFFSMFNNLLGGVFFALMDAYGLELVSVQIWGVLWGALSPAYIIGGLVIARKGLGKNPLRILFLANIAIWSNAIFFAIQPSIILLAIGIAVWLSLFPVIQATEQTIIQKWYHEAIKGVFLGSHAVLSNRSLLLLPLLSVPSHSLFLFPL